MDPLREYQRVTDYTSPGVDQIRGGSSALGQGDLSGLLSILGGGFNSATGFVGANLANMVPEFIATQGGVYEAETGRDKLARDLALLMQISPLAQTAPVAAKPAMRNEVVGVPMGRPGSVLEGRLPMTADEITYAYRSMSKQEFDAAKKAGMFLPPKNPQFTENTKWWSPGDEQGYFGRTWKGGTDAPVQVRLPREAVPGLGAAKFKDAEILDRLTNAYIKALQMGKK